MIMAEQVKEIMRSGELTVRQEECWVSRDGLVQQISYLQQVPFPAVCNRRPQRKIFGARVEIECRKVVGRWPLDRLFFRRGDFGVKLACNGLCNLTLNCKQVRHIAIVGLRPHVCVSVRFDQLRVNPEPIADSLDIAFQKMSNTKLLPNL